MAARQICHQVFNRLIVDRFPGSRNGKHEVSASGAIRLVQLFDQVDVGLEAIGRIAQHDHLLGASRRLKLLLHVAKQRIFRAVIRMGFWAK
jgi:hypothetical protein